MHRVAARAGRVLFALFVIILLGTGCAAPQTQAPADRAAATGGAPSLSDTATPSATRVPPRVVVIDTDMAADDWMAILYLFHRPDIRVKAITISGTGEAHCEPGVRNALGLIALAGYENIPVACGRATPLYGNHAFPVAWREGVDSLFGLSLPEAKSVPHTSARAVDVLTAALQSSSQKVDILTLGPLTNLAETLQKTPALLDQIEMIYIMGGAVDVPGNVASSGTGIGSQAAEWNIYIDPRAANIVFQSGAPITLVPLDATRFVPVTPEFYEKLKRNHSTPEASFIFDFYTRNSGMYQTGTLYFWDQSTAAILSDEALAAYKHLNLCVVELEGRSSGKIETANGCPDIRVAYSISHRDFESLFLSTLNGQAQP